eukprot:CAMPEP_0197940648 /NCGR_PEP_ID=MMETSP1439-20131203/121600_1 /TAXON_ID=66791 /ORGANISM="Gonyaulax spinifera, Strain CCMP409" /LENGTH=69 /DNA_ID=CAMNT_0043563827 /DNA_START=105 /DNA_END=314 /DNA_ORIENTATION=-
MGMEVLEEELALLGPPLALGVYVLSAGGSVSQAVRPVAAVLSHGGQRLMGDGQALLLADRLGAGGHAAG